MPYRFSALPAGEHTVDVVIVDRSTIHRALVVIRGGEIYKGYIGTADTPNMDWSYASALGKSTQFEGRL